jgi:O-antigen/teichoic acid export membrane protein
LLFIAAFTGFSLFYFTAVELFFVAFLFTLNFWAVLLVSLFNSILRTDVSAKAQIISSIVKLVVGFPLMILGWNFVGLVYGIIAASTTVDLILLGYTVILFRKLKTKMDFESSEIKPLFASGFPSWIPYTLTVLAQSLGVLGIYGITGSAETGLYYVAFTVSQIVFALPLSIGVLMLPVLSSLDGGQKGVASKTIQLSLAVTAPLACVFALYSLLLFTLLGVAYEPAAVPLFFLMLGAVVFPIVTGYESYIYAIGKYVQVTILGLVLNVSRLILYALLIVSWGSIGAAIAYSSGLFLALVPIVVSARKLGYGLDWAQYAKTITIPGGIAALLILFHLFWSFGIPLFFPIPWFVGIPLILVVSLIAYARLGILTKADFLEIARAFLSEKSIAKITRYTSPLLRLMFG